MAEATHTAPDRGDNPFAPIYDEASEIQTLASRLNHLARAVSDMAESLCGRGLDKHDSKVLCGIVAFADMSEELAEKVALAGERVEIGANQVRGV